jgi:hypothetical protein
MRGELETRTRRRSQGDGGQDMLTGKQRAILLASTGFWMAMKGRWIGSS